MWRGEKMKGKIAVLLAVAIALLSVSAVSALQSSAQSRQVFTYVKRE
jgi:hypothetical protein